jgi:hypothetical protein
MEHQKEEVKNFHDLHLLLHDQTVIGKYSISRIKKTPSHLVEEAGGSRESQ